MKSKTKLSTTTWIMIGSLIIMTITALVNLKEVKAGVYTNNIVTGDCLKKTTRNKYSGLGNIYSPITEFASLEEVTTWNKRHPNKKAIWCQ